MNMKRPTVVIVLVNWNGLKDTLPCLDSLYRLKSKTYDIIPLVVDNASKDDSIKVISQKFPKAILIPLSANRGFTGANNVGMKWAVDHKADFVWILNNDTLVDENSLSLFDAFKDSTVGATGSKIYFAPGREYHKDRYSKSQQGKVLWFAGGIIDWANVYSSHRGVDEVDHGQYDTVVPTDFITGCSLGLSTKIIREVGMFDDKYFAYLEDVDLSLRIQKAGYKTLYTPSSIVWHVNASSSGGAGSPMHQYFQTRNRLLLGMRHASMRTKFALLRQAVRQLVSGTPAEKKAIKDAAIGRFGAYHG
jgi:GT2 family glycosyltransferase